MMRSMLIASCFVATTVAFADDGARDMTGRKELAMQQCPSAVWNATTKVSDIPDGVTVTVSAADDLLAQQEIRRRVQFQIEIADLPERSAIEHTGLGTGSGRYGFCPGMMAGTSLAVKWLPNGAIMTIRADKAEDVARLQKSTHKRARALAAKRRQIASK
jgi:hypothetical protein